jgi:ribosomal protein L24
MYIKAGMIVRVIRGNHRGEEGKVLNISPKKERVIIEGNAIRDHLKKIHRVVL